MAPLSQLGSVATPVQLRRSGNQFFVPVQIMSLPADLLLDTGTSSTNLSWAPNGAKVWRNSSDSPTLNQ